MRNKLLVTLCVLFITTSVTDAQWKLLNTFSSSVTAVYFDGALGFAGLSSGEIYRSIDQGQTWTKVFQGSPVVDFAFKNNQIGWSASSAGCARTNDGGLSWTMVVTEPFGSQVVYNPLSNRVIMCGTNGRTDFSTDEGDHWQRFYSIAGLEFMTRSAGIAIDNYVGPLGSYTTRDGGLTWSYRTLLFQQWQPAAVRCTGNMYVVYQQKGISRSVDTGGSWSAIGLGPRGMLTGTLRSDGTRLFAQSDSGFFVSEDEAQTWLELGTPHVSNTAKTRFAVNRGQIYAGDAAGKLYINDTFAYRATPKEVKRSSLACTPADASLSVENHGCVPMSVLSFEVENTPFAKVQQTFPIEFTGTPIQIAFQFLPQKHRGSYSTVGHLTYVEHTVERDDTIRESVTLIHTITAEPYPSFPIKKITVSDLCVQTNNNFIFANAACDAITLESGSLAGISGIQFRSTSFPILLARGDSVPIPIDLQVKNRIVDQQLDATFTFRMGGKSFDTTFKFFFSVGVDPQLAMQEGSEDFGQVNVDYSKQKEFVIRNPRCYDIDISDVALAFDREFHFTTPVSPRKILAGATDTLHITFAPTVEGARSDELMMRYSALGVSGDTSFEIHGVGSPKVGVASSAADLIMSLVLNPNPAQDYINASFTSPSASKVNLDVLNVLGASVYQWRGVSSTSSNEVAIPVSSFSQGSYFVRLEVSGQVITTRVQVSH
jgi:photosystem II stability/assembly factor-like uncharacterized protein